MLIVLAVSMFLFVSVIALINGKQDVAAFNQSVGAVKTELQQFANQVGSGYYPNNGSIQCDDSSGGPTLSTDPAGGDHQGSSDKCLFLGKAIQFGVPDPGDATAENYNVYTLVGLRSGVKGGQVDLAATQARVIARASNDPPSIPKDAYEAKLLQFGLTVSTVYPNTSVAFGFITNLTSLGTGDGSQRTDVVTIPGTALGKDDAEGAKEINANIASGTINPVGGVKICFNSGGTNQSALISIGGSGRQGTIESKIFNKKNCS